MFTTMIHKGHLGNALDRQCQHKVMIVMNRLVHIHTHTHTHSDTTKREGAEWLLVDSSEIGESSWFCVLWQPLQRNSTLQPEPPPFLVYHRFSVRSVLNEANEVMDASLLRFALLVCNADPRVWGFTDGKSRGYSLAPFDHFKENLADWLEQAGVTHPDFDFFRKRDSNTQGPLSS
eukprot:GHVR01166004.1.p2 GENE.GHVR01166004.1~~GHVR01166004.1.p2  ORF type:complete len:176 (+),score=45.56 GHVR01166004.1:798-1325(+)